MLNNEMTYFKQETDYTCGPACARMMLSKFGFETFEMDLEKLLDTKPNRGTYYESFDVLLSLYNLEKKQGENKATRETLDELNELVKQGWIVIVAYHLDVPHYSIFTGHNNNHLFLMDPWRGPNTSEMLRKFVHIWNVRPKDYEKIAFEAKVELDLKASEGWWIAFKQK